MPSSVDREMYTLCMNYEMESRGLSLVFLTIRCLRPDPHSVYVCICLCSITNTGHLTGEREYHVPGNLLTQRTQPLDLCVFFLNPFLKQWYYFSQQTDDLLFRGNRLLLDSKN